ncbi:MAG: putative dynein heavy chain, partial [Streblomastix strix]
KCIFGEITSTCYIITFTLSLHLHLGGAFTGSSGTGKTETTKDLAKALARPCDIFNCSDQFDYQMMDRFFSGLVQAGAWALVINDFRCRQKQLTHFEFEGNVIKMNPNSGFFITMNPGYAGRTELPDNLKALFRPVVMMIPDYALIAEIILFSEGFLTAKDLAQKMKQLYKLSSEQLSQQDHYDFDMRVVKSALVMAGALKRKYDKLSEYTVLIRALRDTNTPKFLSDDVYLFMDIIRDSFPGVNIPPVEHAIFQQFITSVLKIQVMQPAQLFILKCLQTTTLNPKAVTIGELYGEFDEIAGEWHDGLVPYYVEKMLERSKEQANKVSSGIGLYSNVSPHIAQKHKLNVPTREIMAFDGPVDAIWIESMNSVLDDNKILCLSNVASRATVSKCSMIYLEKIHLGWEHIAASWINLLIARFPHLEKQQMHNINLEWMQLQEQEEEEEEERLEESRKRKRSKAQSILPKFF